jgi:hypothetical protein
MTITAPEFVSIMQAFLPQHAKRAANLHWVSEDELVTFSLGAYESEDDALRDVPARMDELLSWCTDDEARALVHAGTWRIT